MLKTKKNMARRCAVLAIILIGCCLTPGIEALATEITELVPMGCTVGIEMKMDGVLVVGLSNLETENGPFSPAGNAGIMPGDLLVRLGNCEIRSAQEFIDAASKLTGEEVAVTVRRGERIIQYSVKPLPTEDGAYQLGLWLRDSVSGIGTVTFYDPKSGLYGALGHSITDADTGVIMPLGSGCIIGSTVVDVRKGCSGAPGELCGHFDKNKNWGNILKNTPNGIFGIMMGGAFDVQQKAIPVAKEEEVKLGAATILANVSGTQVEEYAVEITRIYRSNNSGKSMMLTVTDPKLLERTGGIVKGMSGSPIIQNGKLIGAVTHVLVNNPDRGYGISIERMLEAAGGNKISNKAA
ncbi:MAG TPA: SpoIVB peptidase [Clostridiales bacterium]|nr:SpoIVB peptidase [Clostridiales bacterium]